MTDHREGSREYLRTLFCIGVRDPFFAAGPDERKAVFDESRRAFDDLGGRFGVRVLGTMDDDESMVGPIWEIELDEWDDVLATNLRSVFVLTRELAPAMRERGWGRIVNTASLRGSRAASSRARTTPRPRPGSSC